MKRINICINEDVNARAIDYCEKNHISKSALIGTALTQYIDAMEMMPTVQAQLDELKARLDELSKVEKIAR